jgi:hypothetical protein
MLGSVQRKIVKTGCILKGMNQNDEKPWEVLSRFVEIKSPWLTVIGERLRDTDDKDVEYWRIEKADSLLVLLEQNGKFLLPKPQYRPGVQAYTLDFCGGRVNPSININEMARKIVLRELRLNDNVEFVSVDPINSEPWNINSSFENQRLFGYIAKLDDATVVDPARLVSYEQTAEGIQQLLNDLSCLQCRALLLEWERQKRQR